MKLPLNLAGLCISSAIGWAAGIQFQKWKTSTVHAKTLKVEDDIDSEIRLPQSRVQQIMRYGFPGTSNIRSLDNYVISYDFRNRIAYWTLEHLTSEMLHPNDQVDRSKCEFVEDKVIHPFFRSTNEDYKYSGYDRGHLAAAGNHRTSQKHVDQTFLLSNIAPQVGKGFNRNSWNKLEKYIRHLTKKYRNVYVCTGPLFLPKKKRDGKMYVKYEVIGPNHVAVPTHFFKVIVGEINQQYDLEAFIMPNTVIDDNTPIHNFQVPVESIEHAAGLLFFDKIPRERFHAINGKRT